MTVFFNKARDRWSFDFWKGGKRYRGYCLDAHGEPVKSRSAAVQAEGVERRRAELEPKIARPGEMTFAMCVAALTPSWKAQASWPARQGWLKEIIAFFGKDTPISAIDQARTDDYVSQCRTAKISIWKGGPDRDPTAPGNAHFWTVSDAVRAPATVNLYLGTVRQIFARAAAHRNPMTGDLVFKWLPTVPELRRSKRKPRPTPDQVSAEIMAIMPPHVVDAMMLTAMYGFRKGEGFGLLRTQVDWGAQGVRLHAEDVKDDEDAFLPGSQFAMGYLWCLDIEAEARGTRHLITYRRGNNGQWKPIAKPRSAWRRARKFMQAKYGRTWRWHDLRGAFITHVALNNAGVVAQQLARHSDFATTQGYIEVADEIRRLAADRISDRALLIAANESPQHDPTTLKFAASPGRRKLLK